MRVPLASVFRRGAVFLWTSCSDLDDPALAGQTKPKYVVILSASALDDPVYYILTTSEKPKHASFPFHADLFRIPETTYAFFSKETLIDVGQAGELEIGRAEFEALYDSGDVVHKGGLTAHDTDALIELILACRRVSRRFKQIIRG